jgi:tRNA modification GTPase
MTNKNSKTIVGIATPNGFGGVGIVRISGQNALNITLKMFKPNKTAVQIKPRYAMLGKVFGQNFTDTAILIYFNAPHSYTGENVCEIQSHGGWHLLNKIMQTAVKFGAVPAAAGEFTKTAFLNGKISLTEAESIADMINAESDAELSAASVLMSGDLHKQLNEIENRLISVRAEIDAYLDYPDEIDTQHIGITSKTINTVYSKIDKLLSTAQTGKVIKDGITVALIGKPNAGKSSVFNCLIRQNRSIVTEIAGTTTDTITERIIYNGIKINLTDTAGIRDTKNIIEKAGVERTEKAAKEADILLIIVDAVTEDLPAFDRTKQHIIVYNKTDIKMPAAPLYDSICVSAYLNKNIDLIFARIMKIINITPPKENALIITNERHLVHLINAKNFLSHIHPNSTYDRISYEITSALNEIGIITGTNTTEAALNEIFSKFCLGK